MIVCRRVNYVFSTTGVVALALSTRLMAQAGTGTIVGQVSDRDTQQPVVAAVVTVVGTNFVTRTQPDGQYKLTHVPAGPVTIRSLRLGYAANTRSVTVPDGGQVTANFTLERAAQQLDAVVTTATAETQSKRETGANIAVVQLDSLAQAPITTFSQAIDGRISGVVVEPASGETGTGSTVRIRGASSVFLSNEPIYVIDGVRLDNSAFTSNLSLGGQGPSRLDEIPEQDIESIEVLKGPTASAMYGTAAANGVIVITTKRGQPGGTKWDFWGEGANVENQTNWPANYGTLTSNPNFLAPPGYPEATNCTLDQQADYAVDPTTGCQPDVAKGNKGMVTYNPLMQHSPYRIGQRTDAGGSVHGGSENNTYFLSASKVGETGIFRDNALNKATIRANANFQLSSQAGLSLSGSYLTQDLNLPQNDNNYVGPISDGYLGWPVGNTTDGHGHPSYGYNPIPPEQDDQFHNQQNLDHFVLGANGNWHPLSWLTITGVTGLDQDWQHDQELEPQNSVFVSSDDSVGHRASFKETIQTLTDNLSATATARPFTDVTARSTIGVQYYYRNDQIQGGYGKAPTPGTNSLSSATVLQNAAETTFVAKQVGYLASEAFSWKDRRYLTVSVRADNNSSFGHKAGTTYYPAANASWVLSDEAFWPKSSNMSLRLRGAYGSSGLAPTSLDALSYYIGESVIYRDAEHVGLTAGNIGVPGLKPERSDELEGGLEWGFDQERVTFGATAYHKHTTDALVLTTLAGSVGTSPNQLRNLGAVLNEGIELELDADVIRSRSFAFSLTSTFSWNHNELLKLGVNAPYLEVSGTGGFQRFVQGYPLGGFWDVPADSFPRPSANGISGLQNVYWPGNVSQDFKYRGGTLPEREGGITPTFLFFRQVKLLALFDYKGGYKQYDGSEQFRCAFYVCRGNYDVTDNWHDKSCAAYALITASAFADCWVNDASFLKLRELSVQYILPIAWARHLRANGLSLTVSGRNLWTIWTPWKGVDPEVDSFGQDNFGRYQFAVQPLARYFTLRLDASF